MTGAKRRAATLCYPAVMGELWHRIRTNWNTSDTVMFAWTGVSFLLLVGNCWWESQYVVYLATAIPLAFLGARVSHGDVTLRHACIFGGLVGALWPVGEWLVVTYLGWWGTYLVAGPAILETPVYCMLIGCLTSAYCFYLGARTLELGYGRVASGVVCGTSALVAGVIGENLFVAARMWVYEPSMLDWGQVPAFVPVSYGIAYATIPGLRGIPIVPRAFVFTTITLVVSTGLGIATGFFPRDDIAVSSETAPEHPEIRRAYAQDKADWTPLHIAVLYDDMDEIRRLVRENADLDATVPGSLWTPLDVAALYDKAETLAFLVEAWERAHDTAYNYDRSLFLAVIHGNAKAARYLLERGGDPDTKSFDFEPQLRVAATHAHQAVMEVLLEYGVDVTATTASGLTALHGAAERVPEGVELLLRHGADVQVRADNGTTPLHVAARHGRTQAAAVLLAAGADPSSRAVSGKTPLDLAREQGHVSTLQLLEGAIHAP